MSCNNQTFTKQGTNTPYIQTILSYASSKTSERYTHVSNTYFIKFRNSIDDT